MHIVGEHPNAIAREMRALAEKLKADAEPKLSLATQLMKQADELEQGRTHHISHQGIERIRQVSRDQWQTCPQACKRNKGGAVVKHRGSHPHMRARKLKAESAVAA